MRKVILITILILIIPQVALAVWWNPFTWFTSNKSTEVKEVIINSPKEIAKTAVSNPKIAETNLFPVTSVVDGDTIKVNINGKVETIRLIGIDTPETVDPRKPVQCFGVEASNKAKAILTGKKVSLESDSSQGEFDKYNRLLRYVFLEDKTNFNLLMIKEGYAHEYTYDLPYKYQSEFKQAQNIAEINKKGLWASGVCESKPTPVLVPTIIPIPTDSIRSTLQCNPNYSGCLTQNGGDYDCAGGSGNGPNYTGTVQVIGYDEYGLDRDGDGWACEKQGYF
jgi:micrococcal nuclease